MKRALFSAERVRWQTPQGGWCVLGVEVGTTGLGFSEEGDVMFAAEISGAGGMMQAAGSVPSGHWDILKGASEMC